MIYRLCEEIIALREINHRQHKMFDQALARSQEEIQRQFNNFAADTQRAYQQLRQELNGDKRLSLVLLNELLETGLNLERLAAHRPTPEDEEAMGGWAEAVAVEARRVQTALSSLGIQPYDAAVGSPYNPALHERVGSQRVEGMAAFLVAGQQERGYASQQPEFVLRRPKVIVSE
jgi:hypothetical protein